MLFEKFWSDYTKRELDAVLQNLYLFRICRCFVECQVKKHVSRPRPLRFLAPPFFFYYFVMSNVFMSKNQQASLEKPIAAVYTPK